MIALMQQCICAIELIGFRAFRARREVAELRRIRDEVLATTEAGRAWIALFERVQTPLLGALLADERLLAEAGELIRRAAALARDDSQALTDDDVERGIRVVRALSKQAECTGRAERPQGGRDCPGLPSGPADAGCGGASYEQKPHARRSAAKKAASQRATSKTAPTKRSGPNPADPS